MIDSDNLLNLVKTYFSTVFFVWVAGNILLRLLITKKKKKKRKKSKKSESRQFFLLYFMLDCFYFHFWKCGLLAWWRRC